MRTKAQGIQEIERQPVGGASAKRLLAWADYAGPMLRILGLPFGGPFEGRDSDGEAFTEKTDIALRVGDERPLTYYHGYGPDDPTDYQDIPAIIGVARYVGVGEVGGHRGFVFEARLDDTEPLAQRIIEALDEGREVAASSGAVGHMTREDRTGIILTWPVGELAVFDVNGWRLPSNPWAVVEPIGAAEGAAKAQDAQLASVGGEEETAKREEDGDAKQTETTEEEVKMDEETKRQDGAETPAEGGTDVAAMERIAEEAAKRTMEQLSQRLNLPAIITGAKRDEGSGDAVKRFVKALLTTSAEGIVPEQWADQIIQELQGESAMLRAGVRQVQQTRRTMNWQRLEESTTTLDGVAEGAATPEITIATSPVTITLVHRRGYVDVSSELDEFSTPAVVQNLVIPALAAYVGSAETRELAIGTGSGEAEGLTVVGTVGATASSATAITIDDIRALWYSLGQSHRANSVWMMSGATLAAISGLTDGQVPLVQHGADGVERIWGRPIIENAYMPDIAASAKPIALFDPRAYQRHYDPAVKMRRLEEVHLLTSGSVAVYYSLYSTGFLANRSGARILQMSA